MNSKPNYGQPLVDTRGAATQQFQAFLDETDRLITSEAPTGSKRVVNLYHDGTDIIYVLEDGTEV